jgi:hypothetical protein
VRESTHVPGRINFWYCTNSHVSISIMADIEYTVGAILERPRRLTPHRPAKLQICLTTEERARLAEQARAGGYESMSSYVRACTLGGQRRV